ncbi:MAG: hypothetical protein ACIAXF_01500 [Phycisphaerales bacterium JB063]
MRFTQYSHLLVAAAEIQLLTGYGAGYSLNDLRAYQVINYGVDATFSKTSGSIVGCGYSPDEDW